MAQFTLPTSWEESADIILKSNDDVEFRVHTLLLSFASSIFEGMFLVPQPAPSSTTSNELARVDMTESSETLSILLMCIYPVVRARVESLPALQEALKAAIKYEMVAVVTILRTDLLNPTLLDYDANTVYSFACIMNFKTEAREAATQMLSWRREDVLTRTQWASSELRAVDLSRLMMFHKQHSNEIVNSIKDISRPNQAWHGVFCAHCQLAMKMWAALAETEVCDRPVTDMIFSFDFTTRSTGNISGRCTCEGSNPPGILQLINSCQRDVERRLGSQSFQDRLALYI